MAKYTYDLTPFKFQTSAKDELLNSLKKETKIKPTVKQTTKTPVDSKPIVPSVNRLAQKEAVLEPTIAKPGIKPLLAATSEKAGRPVGTNIPAPLAKTTAGAGFQYGVASAFGGKQLGDGSISQNIKAKQAENEKVFNVAKGAGQLTGTAGQYMLANQAVNSAAKVVPLLGNLSKAGKVAATIGTDQLVDNIVRTPQTIIQGKIDNKSGMEIAKDLGKQNVEDLAWNVGMAAGGVVLGKVAEILKKRGKPLADALTDTGIVKEIEEVTGTKQGTPEFNSVVESVSKQTQSPTVVKPTNVAGEVVVDVSKQTNVTPDVSIGKTDKTIPTITDSVKTASVKADNAPFELKLDTPKSKPVVELEKQTWTPETGQKTIDDLKEKGFNLFQFSEFKSKAKAVDVDGVKHFEVNGQAYKGDTIEEAYKTYTTLAEKNAKAPKGMAASKFNQTVQDSSYSTTQLKDMIEEKVVFYEKASTEGRVKIAKEMVDTDLEKAKELVLSGKQFNNDVEAAVAKEVYAELQQQGRFQEAYDVFEATSRKGTKLGQQIQLMSVWKTSTPEGMAYHFQKEIDKINKLGQSRFGKKWQDVKIDEYMQKQIAKSGEMTEAQRIELADEVVMHVNGQLYEIGLDKWDQWRKIAMLSSPKTHFRNITGNTLMWGLDQVKKGLSTSMEQSAIKMGLMKAEDATKSIGWSKNKELKNVVEGQWKNVKDNLMGNGKYDIESVIKFMGQDKRIFKGNTGLKKFVNELGSFTTKTLNMEDEIFMGRAYKDALGQFMNARGLKEVTPLAHEYASQYALEATFRQASDLAKTINKLKGGNKWVGRAVDTVMPFSKTPINIAKTAASHTPLNAVTVVRKLYSGSNPSEVINEISKGLTGTGLVYLGYKLGELGWAKGKWTDRSAEALYQEAGEQPFSISTPLGSFTFDWAQPISVPMVVGLSAYEAMQDKSLGYTEKMGKAIVEGGDAFFNQSFVQNIKQVFEGYGSTTEKIFVDLPIQYIEQGVPTVLGQTAKWLEENERSTYSDNPIEKRLNRNMAKIPAVRTALEPKIDIWGNEISTQGPWTRMAKNVLSPAGLTTKSNDVTTKKLLDLYKVTKDTSILPSSTVLNYGTFQSNKETQRLTEKEMTLYAKEFGKKNYTDYKNILSKYSSIKNLNDTQIEKLVKELDDARKVNMDETKQMILKKKGVQ